jgi:D-alanine-D-alanine ligase
MHVGFTYDLRDDYVAAGYSQLETAEFDRPETIAAIEAELIALGHTVERIGGARNLTARLLAGGRWDLVFNICEGMRGFGREALVPALLDACGIPYAFSDPLACAVTLHKATAKRIVRDRGLPTPDFALVETAADIAAIDLPLPLFVKPVAEGTSKGVTVASVIRRRSQLRSVCLGLLKTYDEPVLVERFLPGREFTAGLIGTGPAARVVGTMEVVLRPGADAEVYSYRNKERCEELVQYRLLDEGQLRAEIEDLAVRCWRALGCRDGGRVDIRCDAEGRPQFLEVNPLAGMHPEHSDLPIICSLQGIAYRDLMRWIIESAAERVVPRRLVSTAA